MEAKPHCHDLLGFLSDYIDGSLREEICVELEHHLAECQNCRIVVDTLKKTIHLYQEGSESLPQPVRLRLYHSLQLDEFVKKA